MNDDERELLKQVCGALGVLSGALADGAGIYELQQISRGIQDKIGPLFERVYPRNPDAPLTISIRMG